jgi:hypothetical protein
MRHDRSATVDTSMLMASSGNLIDSFHDEGSAREALRKILEADRGNAEHVALIGFDANGDPVAPPAPADRRVV